MAAGRPITEIEAANGALAACKQPPIAAFPPTENNIRAREANLHFATVRDTLLCEHPWNFAKAWLQPAAALTNSLNAARPHRYPLPGDCLEVRSVQELGNDEWEMEAAIPVSGGGGVGEAKILVARIPPPITVEYTVQVTNVALWEPLFLEAFELRLAAAMAPKLLRNEGRALELLAEASEKLKRAQMSDRRERARSTVTRSTSYLLVRR